MSNQNRDKRFDELMESMPLYSQENYPKILSFLHSEIQLERQKAFWVGYKAGNDKQIAKEYLSEEEQGDLLKDLDTPNI